MRTRDWKPPRYFAGFVTVEHEGRMSKWVFSGGIMIPTGGHECLIYEFDGGPFAARTDPRLTGYLLEIQYAISIYEVKGGGSFIHKYNHPFELPVRIQPHRRNVYRIHTKSRLYKSFPAAQVMPEAKGCPHTVVQFVA